MTIRGISEVKDTIDILGKHKNFYIISNLDVRGRSGEAVD
jgi:hypothetical protein